MELVLASTSPYRREQLARFGIPFRAVDPRVDEAAIADGAGDPVQLARTLARLKAEAVSAHEPASVVIGGDQLVAFDGRVLGKPGTADRAMAQLRAMAGREHQLVTAVAVAIGAEVEVTVNIARLTLRALTDGEIERYVEADRPLDCAGSYKFESLGIGLFDRVDAADPSAILGLPMIALGRMLRTRGFNIP